MRVAAGVDIGGTKVAVGLVDAAGRLLAHRAEPLATGAPEAPVHQAARMVAELADGRELAGVGVGIPGLPETGAGGVWAPNVPGWESYPLLPVLRRVFGPLPVAVENDGRCAALGEVWAGAGRGASSAVLLVVGTGIGGGVVVEGRLIGGHHGLAGAFGWVRAGGVPGVGAPFVVGASAVAGAPAVAGASPTAGALPPPGDGLLIGPMERVAAGPALDQAAAALGLVGARQLFAACRDGRPEAIAEVRRFAYHVAEIIANVVVTIDPALVIIGGGVGENFPVFEPYLSEAVRQLAHPFAGRLRLAGAALGPQAGIVGAARLVFRD